jgi:hypothetical protein
MNPPGVKAGMARSYMCRTANGSSLNSTTFGINSQPASNHVAMNAAKTIAVDNVKLKKVIHWVPRHFKVSTSDTERRNAAIATSIAESSARMRCPVAEGTTVIYFSEGIFGCIPD